MPEIKKPAHIEEEKNPVAELRTSWERYGKQASYVLIAILLLVGGYLAYRNLIAAADALLDVPHVESAADARAIVERCMYPPLGSRSVSMLPQMAFAGLPAGDAPTARAPARACGSA